MFLENIRFYSKMNTQQSPNDFVVWIPKVQNKDELYNKLRESLKFPDDFGNNWDAFRELFYYINDVEPLNIHIFHQSIADIVPTWDIAMYLSIINEISSGEINDLEHVFYFYFNNEEFDIIAKYWPGKLDTNMLHGFQETL